MKRLYIFPRYNGDENSDWYQKAKHELATRDINVLVIPLTLPNWDEPDIAEFLSFIETAISQSEIDTNTFFVGHSVGCKAALLFLNELQKKNESLKIGGLMCIAGWWTVDKPWLQLEQWINTSVDYNKVQKTCNHNIITLLSDNDPFTSDLQTNKKMWKDKLNAEVIIVSNAKHFNTDGYAEIITELIRFSI